MFRIAVVLLASAAALSQPIPADPRSAVASRVLALTRETRWTLVASIPVGFRTFHPQGMVRRGGRFFVSSVEVRNRDAGEGVGHLFAIDGRGQLVADLRLGEGPIYHPGGIDDDGTDIWVPVAEYRPDSRSIIYRVDPAAMTAAAVFRFADHIGAIVHDTVDRTLYGVSWGSRRFYRWTLDRGGRVTNANVPPAALGTLNPSHYIDYQDCHYVGARRMVCGGGAELRQRPDAPAFRLGGLDLVDLAQGRPVHQVPVPLWTPSGLDMTHNPVWLEPTATGLRAYFMPEDDASTIYVYEAATQH